MALKIGSNIASLGAQRRLADGQTKVQTALERLSSGQRINHAADDAAGLAISTRLNTDSRLFTQAIRNVNDGISLTNIAQGAFSELSNITIRQQELAEQAANGTMTYKQRSSLTAEVRALGEEFNRIVSTTSFNGREIISAGTSVQIAAGIRSSATISFGISSELSRTVGDGTFGSSTPIPSFVCGTGYLIAGADFNEDGFFELVQQGSDGDTIITQRNGDGTFAVTNTLSDSYMAMSAGDLNNDGHTDLAGVYYCDGKTILTSLNQGDGTFTAGPTISSSIGCGEIHLADLNNDGRDDILAVRDSQSLDIYLSAMDGTFIAAPVVSLGAGLGGIFTGDFNGDSYLDAAYTQAGNAKILWGEGHGNFLQAQDTGLPQNAYVQSSGDVNADGIDDLVLIEAGYHPELYLGTSSGTFSAPLSLPDIAYSSVITDVNGDGKSEVVYNSGGRTDIVHFSSSPNGSPTISTVTTCDSIPLSMAGDLNGDGAVDLIGWGAACYGNPHQVTTVQQLSLFSQKDARAALETLSEQLSRVTSELGRLGSAQSRLSTALSNLASSREGYDSAASRISDADVAEESAGLVRARILQEATGAVLAQANQAPALALTLLR